MKIRYLSHTADIRMLIEANSLQELFIVGVHGMNGILKEGFCESNSQFDSKKTIKIAALDYTSLLIDFLSDILSVTYAYKTIYCKIDFKIFSQHEIIAEIYGKQIEHFDEEIKGVTYHEADIKMNKNNCWETCVIFDI